MMWWPAKTTDSEGIPWRNPDGSGSIVIMKPGGWISSWWHLTAAACALLLAACQQSAPPPATATRQPVFAPSPAVAGAAPTASDDSVPAIAQREVIRRREQIRRMDEAALRASQAMAEDDLEGAVSGYRRAVDGLP